jgi:hypothetical protein
VGLVVVGTVVAVAEGEGWGTVGVDVAEERTGTFAVDVAVRREAAPGLLVRPCPPVAAEPRDAAGTAPA